MAFLAPILGGLFSGLTSGGGMAAVGKSVGKAFGGGTTKRRRRRARLTQRELMELQNIKSIIGKTAAANALPYYLGRG